MLYALSMAAKRDAVHGDGFARACAAELVALLKRAGHVAYFAGGCVRDELLGLAPSDFDIATSARPEEISRLVVRAGHQTHFVGESFGVTLVKISGVQVEVATFRRDGVYSDGRRPDAVEFATAQEDAQRRDFTINALFLDPFVREDGSGDATASGKGRIIDLVGGRADLAAGVVRAVGAAEARLGEDHLRALRAVRFAARLGFVLEQQTAAEISRHAKDLGGVSKERMGEEVRRMLGPGLARGAVARCEAMSLLAELGLFTTVFGLVARSVRQVGVGHGASQKASRGTSAWPMLAALGSGRLVTDCLAALVLDAQGGRGEPGQVAERELQKDAVFTLRAALCLSNDECAAIGGLLGLVDDLRGGWAAAGVAQQKRRVARAGFAAACEMIAGTDKLLAGRITARARELILIGPGVSPVPLVDGSTLITAGLRPSPIFKRVLEEVYDAQLEGRVATVGEGIVLALRLAGEQTDGARI